MPLLNLIPYFCLATLFFYDSFVKCYIITNTFKVKQISSQNLNRKKIYIPYTYSYSQNIPYPETK